MKRADFLCVASAAVFLCSAASFANPIPVTAISEVQLISPWDWTVEVDCRNLCIYPSLPAPGITDTITLFCSQSTGTPPPDSMWTCAIPEQIDSNGIMLLTPLHFPGLMLNTGCTLSLGVKARAGTWQVLIPQNLTPQTSLVSGYQSSCCEYTGGTCTMMCSNLIYTVSSCPSIGIRNRSAFGSIGGTVRGGDSLALIKIRVYLTSSPAQSETYVTTDNNGTFSMSSLDLCHMYSLWFADSNGTPISDTVVGPLQLTAGQALTVDVQLNYQYTGVLSRRSVGMLPGGTVRILSSATGRRIVLTVSGIVSPQQGSIGIFSVDGSLVRSITFVCTGTGTYTVPLDGGSEQNQPVPAGTYVCRVRIGKEVSCKDFVAR